MYHALGYRPKTSSHGTMSNLEARRRQQTMRNYKKIYRATPSLENNNNINEPVYPVNISSWAIQEGNKNLKSKATAARANYNMFDRSRHAALWKNEFAKASKTRKRKHKGGVTQEDADKLFSYLTSRRDFKTGTSKQRYRLLSDYVKLHKADLATIPEYAALLQLVLLKYGISPNILMNLK